MEAIRKLGKTVVTVLWDAAYSGMTHDAPVNNLMLISGRLLNSCLTMLQMMGRGSLRAELLKHAKD